MTVQTDESSIYRHYLASTGERDGIFSHFISLVYYFYICTYNMRFHLHIHTKCLKAPVGNDFVLFSISHSMRPHLFPTYKEWWEEEQNKQNYISVLYLYDITNELIHLPCFSLCYFLGFQVMFRFSFFFSVTL